MSVRVRGCNVLAVWRKLTVKHSTMPLALNLGREVYKEQIF